MNLSTERLILREVAETDLNFIHALHSLPETDQYNTMGIPADLSVTQKLVNDLIAEQQLTERNRFALCVEDKEQKFVGLLGLNLGKPGYRRGEVWYKIHPAFWGKGYASEAVKALIRWGFEELKLHRIEAGCATQNKASIRVLEKVGMTREGLGRKLLPIRGEWVDNYTYSILEGEMK